MIEAVVLIALFFTGYVDLCIWLLDASGNAYTKGIELRTRGHSVLAFLADTWGVVLWVFGGLFCCIIPLCLIGGLIMSLLGTCQS